MVEGKEGGTRKFHSFLPPHFCKGRGTRISNRACYSGGNFSEILVGGQKGGIQCFAVVQWGELIEAGQLFRYGLQKKPFRSYLGSCTENKFCHSC